MRDDASSTWPEKTCSIDRLITQAADIARVLSGEKTETRRNGRYADVGEMMVLSGHTYRITAVFVQLLKDMTDDDFHHEGFASRQQYAQHLRHMHRGLTLPWVPSAQVWVHRFEPVNTDVEPLAE